MQVMENNGKDDDLASFAKRMNDICDDKEIPLKGKNRQSKLGGLFGVSQKGARKWLEGEGFPTMATAIRIARWANVNIQWLLTGEGDKRAQIKAQDYGNHRIQHVVQVMENLPDYARDEAVKEIDSIAKLIEQATKAAQK